MPFPRMTTRRWMIAVAVAGLTCYAAVVALHFKRCSDLARHYRQQQQSWQAELRAFEGGRALAEAEIARHSGALAWAERYASKGKVSADQVVACRLELEASRFRLAQADKSVAMARDGLARCEGLTGRYQHAARRPWLPVPPDPPEPE